MTNELFLNIQKAIVELDENILSNLTTTVIEAGLDPIEAIEEGYTVGIQKVGQLFEVGEYFLPELLQAATMVKEAVSKIETIIPSDKIIRRGKIVLGTVEGDIHDIGKNLVGVMLSTRGIEVIDIGVDCHADKFIDRALKENADLIGASCLLTMTAPEQQKLVKRMEERGVRQRFKILLGGAAIDRAWTQEIGADGFGEDLKEAADVAMSLLAEKGGQRA